MGRFIAVILSWVVAIGVMAVCWAGRHEAGLELRRLHERKLLEVAIAQREVAVLRAQLEMQQQTNNRLRKELDTLKGR